MKTVPLLFASTLSAARLIGSTEAFALGRESYMVSSLSFMVSNPPRHRTASRSSVDVAQRSVASAVFATSLASSSSSSSVSSTPALGATAPPPPPTQAQTQTQWNDNNRIDNNELLPSWTNLPARSRSSSSSSSFQRGGPQGNDNDNNEAVTLDDAELLIGRIAMLSATILLGQELFTGVSFLDQVMGAFSTVQGNMCTTTTSMTTTGAAASATTNMAVIELLTRTTTLAQL